MGEPRLRLAVLRALVLAGKASLLPRVEREAIMANEAAKAAVKAKEEQPLQEVLAEAGFCNDTAKQIRDIFQAPTVKVLRAIRLTPEAIEAQLEAPVRQRRIHEGEKRKFARYVRDLRELEEDLAPPAAAALAAAAAGKAAAKSAAKSKAKGQNPASKAALLALVAKGTPGAKGAGRGAACAATTKAGRGASSTAKTPTVTKMAVSLDSVDLVFREHLPDSAFVLVTRFLLGI